MKCKKNALPLLGSANNKTTIQNIYNTDAQQKPQSQPEKLANELESIDGRIMKVESLIGQGSLPLAQVDWLKDRLLASRMLIIGCEIRLRVWAWGSR